MKIFDVDESRRKLAMKINIEFSNDRSKDVNPFLHEWQVRI